MGVNLVMLTALQENLSTILSNNTTIFSLIGMLIIIIAFTKIKQVKFSTSMITQIGVALSASIALSFIKPFTAPYGGSVTLGSMVPIIIISYIYGPIVGVLTGFFKRSIRPYNWSSSNTSSYTDII